MNTNMMELNMNEMELVNGGIEWGKIFKEAAWGVGIGAACGAGVGRLFCMSFANGFIQAWLRKLLLPGQFPPWASDHSEPS